MTLRRFHFAGIAAVALAAGAGVGLALSGADTPIRGPLVLFLLVVAPAMAIAGLLRNLDPLARVIIAVTGAVALDYLVAEIMLAAGAWSSAGGLVAVLVIVAACSAVQIPVVRGRLHASLKASQAVVQRLATAPSGVVRLRGSAGRAGAGARSAARPTRTALMAAIPVRLLRAIAAPKARPGWAVTAVAAVSVALAFAVAPAALPHGPAAVSHGPAALPHDPAAVASPQAQISIGPPHGPQNGPQNGLAVPGQQPSNQRQADPQQPGRSSSPLTTTLSGGHSPGPVPSRSPVPTPGPTTTPPSSAPPPPPRTPPPSPPPSSRQPPPPSPSPSPSKSHPVCIVLLGVRVCL